MAATVGFMTEPDFLLTSLANIANSSEDRYEGPQSGTGVTLFVNGTMITGTVIPNWQYMEDAYRQPSTEMGPFGSIAARFRDVRDRLRQLEEVADDDLTEAQREEINDSLPGYIHLGWAKFGMGQNFAPTSADELSMIRVSLEDISAWLPGSLTPS